MVRRTSILALLACLALSLVCVAYPVYVIRPFRSQGARELMIALMVMRFRLAATIISAAVAVTALAVYWRRQPARWPRALATAAAVLVCVLAALARVNIYELMFHPDTHPSFRAASQMKLDNDERVIAVRIGDMARAYPVRDIAYHHVINDVLDQAAIVATY